MVLKGKVLVAIQFLCLGVLALIPYSARGSAAAKVVGTCFIVAALAILLVAVGNLRLALTIMPEPKVGAPFITQGIYKFVRHPMYLGVIMIGIGLTLIKFSLLGLILTGILIVDLKVKHRYEDRLLLEKWPQARAYQEQVGALFPKVWGM